MSLSYYHHYHHVYFYIISHALGSVVNRIDITTGTKETTDDFDWTLMCRSTVVGDLKQGGNDGHYHSLPQGMYKNNCGLQTVLLSWSGPEYLYHMLRHNNVDLPEEGLAVLRLFCLSDWHTNHQYDFLANDDDWDIKPFVSDFDDLCHRVYQETRSIDSGEFLDEECQRLWDTHYSNIAAKYGADGMLDW